jgi:hypothetical protein
MKANEAFRKFFSLSTWRNITLYLLLFCLGTASILALAFYEPWRYLTFARSSDLILPKDPSNFPRLMIIESPHIDVAKHQESIHPDLPPLYINLPSDLPKEVTDYVEKRNSYIRQLSDNYANSPKESTNTMIIEELLPYEYNGKQGFFAFISEDKRTRLSLFDTSLKEMAEIDQGSKGVSNFVSSKFQDRVWSFHRSFRMGHSLTTVFFEELIIQNDPIINSFLKGSQYGALEVDPYSIMKITHKNTNPRIKTHIPYPKGYFFSPLIYLHRYFPYTVRNIISDAYWFLFYSINSILRFLVVVVLTLFLALISITLIQKYKQKKGMQHES